jgi:hypothetical protein
MFFLGMYIHYTEIYEIKIKLLKQNLKFKIKLDIDTKSVFDIGFNKKSAIFSKKFGLKDLVYDKYIR